MWKWTDYEYTEENKNRRKVIPTRDYRLDTGWANRWERAIDMGVLKSRQSYRIFIKHVRSKQMVYGVVLFLGTVWLSGWFANANSDMRFESLLSLVLGVIILAVFTTKKGKDK